MTKKELLKELGLDSSYIIHEYVETDKVIFVIVNKENAKEPLDYTTGEYAKRKSGGGWISPNYIADSDIYKEIKGVENQVDKLK